MATATTGGVKTETLTDGTLVFRLRFRAYGRRRSVRLHERRDCDCGCGGGWNERTADVELENILACVKAGVWEPPKRASQPRAAATDSEVPDLPRIHLGMAASQDRRRPRRDTDR